MQQVLCPHCGSPVLLDESAEAAQLRQEQEREILRLQSELEQICTRFELQLQEKDSQITIYKDVVERLTGNAPSLPMTDDLRDIDAVISELDQSIARLRRARETLAKLSAQ